MFKDFFWFRNTSDDPPILDVELLLVFWGSIPLWSLQGFWTFGRLQHGRRSIHQSRLPLLANEVVACMFCTEQLVGIRSYFSWRESRFGILSLQTELNTLQEHETKWTRWFKVPFSSPSWRSLNPLKGSLNHPKKVTLNHQEVIYYMTSYHKNNDNLSVYSL